MTTNEVPTRSFVIGTGTLGSTWHVQTTWALPDQPRAEKNPATQERYFRQQGILIGTKGLEKADTMLAPPAVKMASIIDGTSHTLMVTECTGRGTEKEDEDPNGAWVSGKNITHISHAVNRKGAKRSWNDELIFSEHASGANGAYADGSVRFLSSGITKDVILAQCSRNGGELLKESD